MEIYSLLVSNNDNQVSKCEYNVVTRFIKLKSPYPIKVRPFLKSNHGTLNQSRKNTFWWLEWAKICILLLSDDFVVTQPHCVKI